MKPFAISSTFNLYYPTTTVFSEKIRRGASFYREHGLDAAEFSAAGLDLAGEGWKQQVDDLLAISEEYGIRFASAHLPFIKSGGVRDDAYMEQFDHAMYHAIDAMARLGVDFAVVHPNAATELVKDFCRQEQYDLVMKHLAPYVEHAEHVGLSIVVENMRLNHGMRHSHRYCQDPDELCEIADALGVGVCWDFGHANISGIKQSEGLAYVGKRLKALHVNDNSGIDDDHILPFMGTVDWRDAMHGLALAGYQGVFNFEIKTGRVPPALRASFANYLVQIAKELISYIK